LKDILVFSQKYPVRNIDEILASFISMHRRNPYTGEGKISFMDEMLIKSNQPLNDDSRCQMLAGPMGILGQSYNGLKTVFEQGKQNSIHLIEYDDLINQPKETMEKIYDFLEEKYFEHDYQNIENIHREKDKEVYGLADMHKVRKSLNKVSEDPKKLLSENILNLCKGVEFWRDVKEFDPAEQEEDENEMNFLNTNFDNNEKIIGA
jgi:sulfotransferase